jgi:two-component system, chemotaxis family, chemotaxis protein CheY
MAKILIVDDSSMSRRILRRILEPAGHTVLEAEDGMVAIERYFLDRPDVVLLDMTMKGMHGLEVLQKLREHDPQARVVVATADIQSSTRSMVAAAGGSGFICKPFQDDQVLNAVNSVLPGGAL